MQLQEARSTTDLSFRFRTARQDTLIFLAAGRTDYCLVVLQASMLKASTRYYAPILASFIGCRAKASID